jgi:hypothetical protein
VLRDTRSVRDAVEIDLCVAESSANPIEVLDCDTRRVQRYLCSRLHAIETSLGFRRDLSIGCTVQNLVVEHAIQGVRLSRTALVYQDDVAVTMDALERGSGGGIKSCGRHSGTAREDKKGIRQSTAADCWYARNVELNSAATWLGRVFGDAEITAFRGDDRKSHRVLELAGRKKWRRGGSSRERSGG